MRGGPMTGETATANIILAGNDLIAIDATGVAILRSIATTPEITRGPVFAQEQMARGIELGLGISKPKHIEFVTGDKESSECAR